MIRVDDDDDNVNACAFLVCCFLDMRMPSNERFVHVCRLVLCPGMAPHSLYNSQQSVVDGEKERRTSVCVCVYTCTVLSYIDIGSSQW